MATLHVRVDEKTKEEAAKTLARIGISVSDAVRMLLVRVAAEKALPLKNGSRTPPLSAPCAPLPVPRGSGIVPPATSYKDFGI